MCSIESPDNCCWPNPRPETDMGQCDRNGWTAQVLPESNPTPQGIKAPAVEGATNWMSTAFHPDTGLFYVMALEKCTDLQEGGRCLEGRRADYWRRHFQRAQ